MAANGWTRARKGVVRFMSTRWTTSTAPSPGRACRVLSPGIGSMIAGSTSIEKSRGDQANPWCTIGTTARWPSRTISSRDRASIRPNAEAAWRHLRSESLYSKSASRPSGESTSAPRSTRTP